MTIFSKSGSINFIRMGKKFGFNFNEHKNKKIGFLREYVRR
jgi:hypothetical protein